MLKLIGGDGPIYRGGIFGADRASGGSLGTLVSPPSGFPSVPFGAQFYRSGTTYSTDFNPQNPLVEGAPGVTTFYIDIATGLDTNPGTSAQPFRTISRACQTLRATAPQLLLRVRGGVYPFGTGMTKAPEATTFAMVSWDGAPVIVTNEIQGLTWTLDTGTTYFAGSLPGEARNGSVVTDAAFPDAFGDHARLLVAADLAACRATPGSYWTDSANNRIYVNTQNGRVPDANIFVYEGQAAAGQYQNYPAAPAAGQCYFENIRFFGGGSSFLLRQTDTTPANRIVGVFRNCQFKYARIFTGMAYVNGGCDAAFINCLAAGGQLDGFSYHGSTTAIPRGLEINCEARTNGLMPSAANQGSTMHDGGTIVRLNGFYHNNQNDQIADVNTSFSWNMGCLAWNGRSANFSGFRAGNNVGNPSMWLWSCSSQGNTFDLHADGTGAVIRTLNFSGAASNTGTGQIIAEDPVAPVISGVPTITGSALVGQTLTAVAAPVTGGFPASTRTWQWTRDGADIPGAEASTFALTGVDTGTLIRVRQIEINANGTTSATSAAVGPITASYSPAVLFSASEPGFWAPVTMSRLWQDVARSNPVTATGQRVASWELTTATSVVYAQNTGPSSGHPTYQEDNGIGYLDFDGLSNSLTISSFDFSGTDAVTVIAGVLRRGTSSGVIAELGNADSVNGSWNLLNFSTGVYATSRGTTTRVVSQTGLYTAPARLVSSMTADISDDVVLVRMNKVQRAISNLDQGTGNFSINNIRIGQRAPSGFPMDGRLYGLIVRGAVTSGASLTDAEDWMNGLTGAY